MKQIGFKNFRKFKELPPMTLAPITIFVGENNAGKSTVVKGMLALSDFLNETDKNSFRFVPVEDLLEENETVEEQNLKLLKEIKFYFNTSYLAHIGTFKRALYNKAKNDAITFYADLGTLAITIIIKGDHLNEEAVSGKVSLLKINITQYNIDMIIDIDSDEATLVFNPNPRNNSRPSSERLNNYFSIVKKKLTLHSSISENWVPYNSMLIQSFISMFEMLVNSTLVNAASDKNFISVYNWDKAPLFNNLSKNKINYLLRIVNTIFPNSITANSLITKFTFMDPLKKRYSRMADIE